jgi:threonyl-tRNA synthetase
MLHRVVYGSLERFLGILIEHYAGRFPLWLAPVQVRILTVADRHYEYAQTLRKRMQDAGLRTDVDSKAQTIAYKVRDAQLQRIPLIIIVGDKEVESSKVSVRTLDGKVRFGIDPEKLINAIHENVSAREMKFDLSAI